MVWLVLKLQTFKDARCITAAHAANTWRRAAQQYRTPGTERVWVPRHTHRTVSAKSCTPKLTHMIQRCYCVHNAFYTIRKNNSKQCGSITQVHKTWPSRYASIDTDGATHGCLWFSSFVVHPWAMSVVIISPFLLMLLTCIVDMLGTVGVWIWIKSLIPMSILSAFIHFSTN